MKKLYGVLLAILFLLTYTNHSIAQNKIVELYT